MTEINNNNSSKLCSQLEDSQICKFFEGKTVFLTGASGFIGQLQLEKLLRINCKLIYVLFRSAKNKSSEDRLNKILEGPIFTQLKEQNSEIFKKIKIIEGSLDQIQLNINSNDLNDILENVEIIIHSAADIRFDISVFEMTIVNIRGTRELLKIAKDAKKLKIFLYLSTAYSQCTRQFIEEKFYKPPIDPHFLIKLSEKVISENTVDLYDIVLNKVIPPWPNSYTFTKAVGEDIVREFGNFIPVAIVRPSIVSSTLSDPIPGWFNNFSGVNGVLAGCACGFIRYLPVKNSSILDIVCADYVVNRSLAVISYVHQQNTLLNETTGNLIKPQIFNMVSGTDNPLIMSNFHYLTYRYGLAIPVTDDAIWYPNAKIIDQKWARQPNSLLNHFLFGFVYDLFLKLTGSKMRLLSIYRKMEYFLELLTFFADRSWKFETKKSAVLFDWMNEMDKKMFPSDVSNINWKDYIISYLLGYQKFMIKSKLSHKKNLQKLMLLKYLRIVINVILIISFCYILNLILF